MALPWKLYSASADYGEPHSNTCIRRMLRRPGSGAAGRKTRLSVPEADPGATAYD